MLSRKKTILNKKLFCITLANKILLLGGIYLLSTTFQKKIDFINMCLVTYLDLTILL